MVSDFEQYNGQSLTSEGSILILASRQSSSHVEQEPVAK